MDYILSEKMCYRLYQDFTIVLHHGTGKYLRMNKSAGEIIKRLDEGEKSFSDSELDFIRQLKKHQIVVEENKLPEHRIEASNSKPSAEPRILTDLNSYAKERLIPLNCQIELTYRCGLKCKHCYLGNEKPDVTKEMSTDEIKQFIDELADLGGLFLTLTGGEAFARSDLEEIYLHARKRRFAVSVLTSGWGVKLDLLERLVGYGMDSAQVSIHGYDQQSHDAFTMKNGSFNAAMATLIKLKQLGVMVRAAVSVHQENYHCIDKILELLDKNEIVHSFNVNMLPTLTGKTTNQDLQLTEGQIEKIAGIKPVRSRFRMSELSADDYVCGAGRSVISLNPYGEVYPCINLRKSLGNIREKSFTEIWKLPQQNSSIRNLKFKDLADCPECEKRAYCNRCTGIAAMQGLSIKDHSVLDCVQATVYSKAYHDSGKV